MHASKSIYEMSIFIIPMLQVRKRSHTRIYLCNTISKRQTLALVNCKAFLAFHICELYWYMISFDLIHPSLFAHMEEVRPMKVSLCFQQLCRLRTVQALEPRTSESWSWPLPSETSCLSFAGLASRSVLKMRTSQTEWEIWNYGDLKQLMEECCNRICFIASPCSLGSRVFQINTNS